MPTQRVPAVLKELGGVEVTKSALSQDAQKQAEGALGTVYQQLRAGVREAPVVYTDDTGWRIGGLPAQLMVFDTDGATVYQVRRQHRNEEVRELVPAIFGEPWCVTGARAYDAEELSCLDQQKCLGHLQRNASEVAATKSGRARQCYPTLRKQGQELISATLRRIAPGFAFRCLALTFQPAHQLLFSAIVSSDAILLPSTHSLRL